MLYRMVKKMKKYIFLRIINLLYFFFLPQCWLGNIEGPIIFKSTKHMKLVRAAVGAQHL